MKNALLFRINAWHEVWGTHALVDEITDQFGVSDISTVATPQTDTLEFLQNDSRFKEIILFPPEATQQKTFKLWRKVIGRKKFDVNILAFYNELPERHLPHVLSLLLCRGKKYFYQHGTGYFSIYSRKGILVLWKVIRFQLFKRLMLRWEKMLFKSSSTISSNLTDQPIKRVLWMRPDHLGDVLMTLPTLKVLKYYFPEAEIDALVRPDSAEMLKSVRDFNQIHLLNIAPYTDAPMDNAQFQQLIDTLSARQYDLSIDFRGDETLRKLAYKLNIPFRVGQSGLKSNGAVSDHSFLLTHPVDYPADVEQSIERNIVLIEKVGLHCDEIILDLPIDYEKLRAVQEVLRNKKIPSKIVILHTQSRDYLRGWIPERYAQVADYLISSHGFHVVLTGAPENSKYHEQIMKNMKFPDKVHNTAGWFTLTELPAIIKLASIMVTIDSGPMHIAAAVGTPVVALMLPNFVKSSYPYGKNNRVLVPNDSDIISLAKDKNNDGLMLKAITVESVIDAIGFVLREEHRNR